MPFGKNAALFGRAGTCVAADQGPLDELDISTEREFSAPSIGHSTSLYGGSGVVPFPLPLH
eukprot:COSAG01_NODE_1174_length_11380_cov_2.922205_7_plen_61_part_00